MDTRLNTRTISRTVARRHELTSAKHARKISGTTGNLDRSTLQCVSNCAAASGKIWEAVHHFLFTCGERLCSCASTSGIHCMSLTAGLKKRQINKAADSVHLFVLIRDLAQDQVTYSPASKQLYTSVVEYERNIVESSNLRRDRCAQTYICLLCSEWALTNQRQGSCTESAR
jgi:hypothetical protein